ncbi:hypothetical protein [Photobacterium damselae]|uniref:hypothetical protein n=1 Tax=Photobacterium damselae TaxID=38293 RepID=UPI001D17D2BC|nr:hypothetical protein [Photobacterium damselae]
MRSEPDTFTASASFKLDAKVNKAKLVVMTDNSKIQSMALAIVVVTGLNGRLGTLFQSYLYFTATKG